MQAALLSSLSHDLRTPFSSIIGAVRASGNWVTACRLETRVDLLASVEEEADRLNRFVNTCSRSRGSRRGRSGPPRADRVGCRHRQTGRATRRLHADLAVEISIASDMPPVLADELLLEQVLFNLLDNARKYGGPTRSASSRASRRAGPVFPSPISRGIPEADLEKIFEKFYRRAKGDGRPAGTGLGLAICRGLVEAMGGSISAVSPAVRKRGTRFIIRLPLAPPEA